MKATTKGARRAAAGLRLLAASLAVVAAVAARAGEAGAGSEADLPREGLGAEDLRPEGLRPEGLRPEGPWSEDLVSALRANGAEVVPLGSRGGLDGYLVMPSTGTGYSLYLTENGHAVAGLLYGPDGMEITGAQLATARPAAASGQGGGGATAETLVPERVAPAMTAHATSDTGGPASSSASRTRLLERSAAAFGFTLGESGPLVVLLGDPTCSFSRSAVARLGRAALDGRLQLRVVPVGVLGGAAARRAAGIASSADPARAWFEGGGAADSTGAGRIARNNALLDEWGASAVPLIAWQSHDGAVGHRVGDIDDVGAWLAETGLE